MITRILTAVLMMLAARVALVAQEKPVAPKPTPVFTALAWDFFDASEELVLNYTHRKTLRAVQIPWRDRSQPLPFDGAGEIVFSRTVTRDGKKVEEPVASAVIPEGLSRVLLVFGRDPAAGAASPRIMVVDDSYAVFPGQSVRFLNYSKMTLGGTLGAKEFEVAPGGDRVVPATLPETNRLLPFRLARRDDQGGWRKLRSTGLPMAERMRLLVFLIEDPARPGRPEMVMLRDREEIPPAQPDALGGPSLAKASSLRVNPAPR